VRLSLGDVWLGGTAHGTPSTPTLIQCPGNGGPARGPKVPRALRRVYFGTSDAVLGTIDCFFRPF
jgi:hypothetical protein